MTQRIELPVEVEMLVSQLSAEQKTALSAFLNVQSEQDNPHLKTPKHLFHRTVSKKLLERGVEVPPMKVGITKLNEIVNSIEIQLERGFQSAPLDRPIRRIDRMKMYELFAKTVIDYLEKRSLPITMRMVLNQQSTFWRLFESDFPDYISSGILWLLLDSYKGN